MDKLYSTLAELAEKLGIGVNELYGWATDSGLPSYAHFKSLETGTRSAILLAVIAVILLVAWRADKVRAKTDEWDAVWIAACTTETVSVGVAIVLTCVFCVCVYDFVLWTCEPQGMLIDMVIRRVL